MDYIIVGAGITGLYSAYILNNRNPDSRIMVIEKLGRTGGRMGTVRWHNTDITRGAGIVRVKKDHLLTSLASSLAVPIRAFKHKISYADTIKSQSQSQKEINRDLQALEKNLGDARVGENFQSYARRVLGHEEYQRFMTVNGYTDYENADPRATIEDYDFDDNLGGNMFGSISWNELLEVLENRLRDGGVEIRLSCPVRKIRRQRTGFMLETAQGVMYCRNLVMATTVMPARRLLHGIISAKTARLLSFVAPQPFLYIYAKVDIPRSERFCKEITGYTVALPPVQKIIPFNREEGVYMIVYADNESARFMKNIRTMRELEMVVKKCTGLPVKLLDMRKLYWSCGTHYYKPLPPDIPVRDLLEAVRHPQDDLYILGEGLSMEQGWVEGALLSVQNTLI